MVQFARHGNVRHLIFVKQKRRDDPQMNYTNAPSALDFAAAEESAAVSPWLNRAAFLLSAIGLLVAGYLWYSHATNQSIACGNSSGCDTVAQSDYARFPIGWGPYVAMYGTLGYVGILLLSFLRTLTDDARRDSRLLSLIVLGALVGTLFSGYLTYVEAEIIRAWCKWCLASQTIIALVFLISGVEWLQFRRRQPIITTAADAEPSASRLEERTA